MKRLLFASVALTSILMPYANADVRCFCILLPGQSQCSSTTASNLFIIDYGRGIVNWCGGWVSAQITETDIRWNCTNRLSIDHYYFDRNTFDVTQRREYNEDVNARNFTNAFSLRKVECQKPPRDLR